MKNGYLTILIVLMIMLLAAPALFTSGAKEEALDSPVQQAPAQVERVEGDPDSLIQRFSYAFGYLSAMSFMQQGIEIDSDFFAMAVRDSYAGSDPVMTIEEMNAALEEYQMKMQADAMAFEEEYAKANLMEAEQFLAENALREEVVTTESGLQYEILVQGSGASPGEQDVVTVHYTGKFLDGMVFDSSHMYGEPVTFPLSGVITGWTEGLQHMSVGSTFMFYLHPDLAYGRRGAPPDIGPNEMLVFEVELIGIE